MKRIILLAALALAAVSSAGCSSTRTADGLAEPTRSLWTTGAAYAPVPTSVPTPAPTATPVPTPAPTATPVREIIYSVTSEGGINSVTYSTPGFNQQQDTDVSGRTWNKTISSLGVSYASVLAQNDGGGTITCAITLDGRQVTTQSSHGQYAIVTCSITIKYPS
jgi:hypothetical protein